MTSIPEMIEANRANWDARVPVHLRGYGLDHLRGGGQRLADFEYAAIDVDGRDVVHLQCHIGTDTICLSRHGARAVGLDLSGASVAAARDLAAECEVDVEYVESDVHAAVEALGGRRFDVVYTGKGALCWLPDLHRWAQVVAELLRPGGVLYAIDFHPLMLAAADGQPATGSTRCSTPCCRQACGSPGSSSTTSAAGPGSGGWPTSVTAGTAGPRALPASR